MPVSIRATLSAVILLAVCGCIPLPHPHIEHPRVKLLITDSAGRGIAGARVRVYSGATPTIWYTRVTDALADSAGFASAPRSWYWHPVMLLVADAEGGSPFGWCIDAPGFGALARADRGSSAITSSIALARASDSATVRCPDPPFDIDSLRVWVPGRGRFHQRPAR